MVLRNLNGDTEFLRLGYCKVGAILLKNLYHKSVV
jgi:hypothetical protein